MLDHEKEASLEDAGSPVQGFQKEGADDDTDKFVQALDEADTEAAILQDQYRLISMTGTTNREQAEAYRDRLPAGFAMESFTTFPTRTNVVVALEALSTGIKIAMAAGIIALLGATVFFLTRASGRRVEKAIEADLARSIERSFRQTFDASPEMRREADRLAQERQGTAKRELVDFQTQFAAKLADKAPTELLLRVATNDYTELSHFLSMTLHDDVREFSRYIKEVLLHTVNAAKELGAEGTVESVQAKAGTRFKKNELKGQIIDQLKAWAKKESLDGDSVNAIESSFRAKLLKSVDPKALASTIRGAAISKETDFGSSERANRQMLNAKGVLAELAEVVHKAVGRLEDPSGTRSPIPREVNQAIRAIADQAKEFAHGFDLIFAIYAVENQTLNQVLKAKAAVTGEFLRDVSSVAMDAELEQGREVMARARRAYEAMNSAKESDFSKHLKEMSEKLAGTKPKEGDYLPHGDLPDDVKEAMRKFRSKDNDGPIII